MCTRLGWEGMERTLSNHVEVLYGWLCEAESAADYTYRVEDIESAWPEIQNHVWWLGDWTEQHSSLRLTINSRAQSPKYKPVTWDDILGCARGDRLAAMADKYGYEVI
jgi:hypothetical protein